MIHRPLNVEEHRIADIAKHRITLKRKLRKSGCPFDNDDSTKLLETLVKFISSEVTDEDRIFIDCGDDNYGTR